MENEHPPDQITHLIFYFLMEIYNFKIKHFTKTLKENKITNTKFCLTIAPLYILPKISSIRAPQLSLNS